MAGGEMRLLSGPGLFLFANLCLFSERRKAASVNVH
jgi:hypothetical protein